MHKSDLVDSNGDLLRCVPTPFRTNIAFTQVSFRDPIVDAKVFVLQHLHGTGSHRSTLDCVASRVTFRQDRFWSYDGLFQDSFDPEWTFWQREVEYKWRLYGDYFGRRTGNETEAAVPDAREASVQELYSQQTYSRRVGMLIPESNQALTRKRYDWLELASEANLGAPTAMTIVVARLQII